MRGPAGGTVIPARLRGTRAHAQLGLLERVAAQPHGGVSRPVAPEPRYTIEGNHRGLVKPGNLNLNARPTVHNPDGTISTVRSIGIGVDGHEVLIPTVVGGRVVSNERAIDHYRRTGEHLGVFTDPAAAHAYGQALHQEQAQDYAQPQTKRSLTPLGKRLELARQHTATLAKIGLTPEQFAGMSDEQVSTHADKVMREKLTQHLASENAKTAAISPGNDWWGRLVSGFMDMGIMAPYGAVKAVEHPGQAGHAIKHSFGQTIQHPIRQLQQDPATFLVNTFGAISAGAGTVGKVGAIGKALAGAGEASFGDALRALPSADRAPFDALADPRSVAGGMSRHTLSRLEKPSPHLAEVLRHAPELAARREGLLKAVADKKLVVTPSTPLRAVTNAVRDAMATKTGRVAHAALAPHPVASRSLTLPGAETPESIAARAAGVADHEPEFMPPTVVQRLGSKNALVNLLQRRVLDMHAQRRIDAGALHTAPEGFVPGAGFVGDTGRNVTSLAGSVGRNLDAERQVYERLAQAPAGRIERFGKTRAARLIGVITRDRIDRGALVAPSRRRQLSVIEQKLVQIASSPGLGEHGLSELEALKAAAPTRSSDVVQAEINKLEGLLKGQKVSGEPYKRTIKYDAGAVRGKLANLRGELASAKRAEKAVADAKFPKSAQDTLEAAARLHMAYHAVHADRAHKAGEEEFYANHAAQFGLAKAAAELAKKGVRPHVEQAIREARSIIKKREQLLPDEKLSDARALHRLGGQALELEHGAKGLKTPLQAIEELQKDVARHRELASTRNGARLLGYKRLLDKVEETIAARGTHAHGAHIDELRAELADFVHHHGDLQDIFGTAGAQRAAEQGLELDERGVLKQGPVPPTSRTFVAEPGRAPVTVELGAPHTVESATARLKQIEGLRDKAIERIYDMLKKRYYPDGFGTPELKAETALRNKARGPKAKKVKKGRAGEMRGFGGLHVPTLKEELMEEAERQFNAGLEKNKDHPEVQRLLAAEQEAESLRRGLDVMHEQHLFNAPAEGQSKLLTAEEALGRQTSGGATMTVRGREPGVRLEETSSVPHLAEALPAARAALAHIEGEKTANYGLTSQQALLKDAIDKIVSHGKYGEKMTDLLRLEAGRKGRETELVGLHRDLIAAGKIARDKGAFYLPFKGLHDVKRVVPEATHGRSQYGLSPGDMRAQSLTHAYKAALMRQGNFRVDATGLAADSYREAQKMAALRRGFEQMWSMSQDTRDAAGGKFAVPIRATREVPTMLKRLITRADMGELTPHDRALVERLGGDSDELRRWFFPDPETIDAATNLSADGVPVRWVDSRTVAGAMRQQPRFVVRVRGREIEPLGLVDIPNNFLRGGILYTKPAYALNLVQGIGMNAIQQGVFTPSNLTRALRLGRDLGADDQAAVFSLMGEGLSRSLEPGAGPFQAGLHEAGEFWNAVVDRMPRAASWLHEARREGFVSPGQIHTLLRDPRLQAKLVEITRRANNEIIDYSLSPFEKAILKRAIFFYPWIKGSTMWTLRFPIEHPVQAAVIGNLSEGLGRPAYDKEIGLAPSYAESLIRVPGNRTINLAPLNTFETPIDVGRGIAALAHPRDPRAATLFGELSPVAGALATLLTGKTALGHDVPQDESRLSAALSAVADALPPLAFYQRLTSHDTTLNPARQHVYGGGLGTAAGKYGIGGAFPTPTNFDALHAKGKTEEIAAAGSRGALDIRYHDALTQLHEAIPRLVTAGKLDADEQQRVFKLVSSAVALEHARDVAVYDYAKAHGKSTRDVSPGERVIVELRLLAHLPEGDPRRYDGAGDVIKRIESGEVNVSSELAGRFWTARAGTGVVLSTWKRYLDSVHEKYAGGG